MTLFPFTSYRSRGCFLAILALAACLGCAEKAPHEKLDLAEIPPPRGLDQLDPAVQESYAEHRQALDALLGRSSVTFAGLSEAYGTLGMWHQLYDYNESALACYRNAETLSPKAFRWPYLQGHVYRKVAEEEQARAAFERARALEPQHLAPRIRLGELELDAGRTDEARRLFEDVLADDSTATWGHLGLGKVALIQQRFDDAVGHMETAFAQQPQATEVLHTLGLAYRGIGDLDRAERYMAAAQVDNRFLILVTIKADPLDDLRALRRDARYYSRLGKLHLDARRFEAAAAAFRTAVEADPENPNSRLNLGLALLRLNQPQAAVEQFEAILQRQPDHAQALYARAITRTRLNDLAGAEADYRAAVASNPDHMGAHFNLGNLLRQSNRYDEALGHYSEAVRIDPANVYARYWRAAGLVRLERFVEARRTLEQDLEELGPAGPLRLLLARLLATSPDPRARDGEQALRLALDGFRQKPDLAQAEAVAMAYAERGDYEQAVAWQQACLAAAQASGQADVVAWVQQRLDHYQARQPIRAVTLATEHPTTIVVTPPERGGMD